MMSDLSKKIERGQQHAIHKKMLRFDTSGKQFGEDEARKFPRRVATVEYCEDDVLNLECDRQCWEHGERGDTGWGRG